MTARWELMASLEVRIHRCRPTLFLKWSGSGFGRARPSSPYLNQCAAWCNFRLDASLTKRACVCSVLRWSYSAYNSQHRIHLYQICYQWNYRFCLLLLLYISSKFHVAVCQRTKLTYAAFLFPTTWLFPLFLSLWYDRLQICMYNILLRSGRSYSRKILSLESRSFPFLISEQFLFWFCNE